MMETSGVRKSDATGGSGGGDPSATNNAHRPSQFHRRSFLRKCVSTLTCGCCDEGDSLVGEIVLITGSGNGLGRLMALEFARLGCRLVLWDVNTAGNHQTAAMIRKNGGEAYSYYCDISKRECVYETALKVKNEVGVVSILVNNAGIVSGTEFLKLDDEKIIKTFEVNALAHFWTCKAFLPDMLAANHGHLVSIASVAGLVPFNDLSDYTASKYAAVGFQEALKLEYSLRGYDGIHSTTVCPFVMRTQMFAGAQSPVLGFLDPTAVAAKVVKAVRKRKALLVIPGYFHAFPFFKRMFPDCIVWLIYRFVGAKNSMTNFTGHNENGANSAQSKTPELNAFDNSAASEKL